MKLDFRNQSIHTKMTVPGDKSISHRSIMFGAIAHGITTVRGFLYSDDCKNTISCFRQLGVEIEEKEDILLINGKGIENFQVPTTDLDVGNSGTTIRLMAGILASSSILATIKGDESIARRPMARVINPLREMGAYIEANPGNFPPLKIEGKELKGISYEMPMASAQVKSAILLAGLHADGETRIVEPISSRDHTERFIKAFGGNITVQKNEIVLQGKQRLTGQDIHVPGDISSAAFWMVAAAITPGSEVTIERVCLNPTRTGIIDAMIKMGVNIQIEELSGKGEPIGNITVRHSNTVGTVIDGSLIPRLIDEIPILALLASQSNGQTIIRDAEELRVKETDRIQAISEQLSLLGATITPTPDGLIIQGNSKLHGATVNSLGDHRIGMMLVVAALVTNSPIEIANPEAIAVSYPTFIEDLKNALRESRK